MSEIIGIDPGTVTGVSLWNVTEQKFEFIGSMSIHRAMKFVSDSKPALVRVEDSREWFGNGSREKIQGAGSIKRDCTIWRDFLTDEGIKFEMVAARFNTTKLNAAEFKKRTGWQMPTNEHARDSAGLVFNFTERNLINTLRIIQL